MSRDWYGVFDEIREATLEFAASAAEVYAGTVGRCDCGMPDCRSCASASRSDCRTGGDFLGDWVRLNVSYMSQLARMSSAYAGLATRAFGSLYGAMTPYPAPRTAARSEVLLAGPAGTTASATFNVTNSLGCDERLEVEGKKRGGGVTVKLQPRGEGDAEEATAHLMRERDGEPLDGVELAPGACVRGLIAVELPKVAGTYTGGVKLSIGECTRRLRLRIHVR